jgi:hypothetical protein
LQLWFFILEVAPHKGDDPVTMHYGDIVNMIDTTTNSINHQISEFITDQHVDFICEASKHEMKIRVHYDQFLAQNQLVLEALRLNTQLPERKFNRDRPAVTYTVLPGMLFMYKGSLVEVTTVNKNNVLVRDDETSYEFNIDVLDAATLIRNYLE